MAKHTFILLFTAILFFNNLNAQKYRSITQVVANKSYSDHGNKWIFIFSQKYLIVKSQTNAISEKFILSKIERGGLEYKSTSSNGLASVYAKWNTDGYGNNYYENDININVSSNKVWHRGSVKDYRKKTKEEKEIDDLKAFWLSDGPPIKIKKPTYSFQNKTKSITAENENTKKLIELLISKGVNSIFAESNKYRASMAANSLGTLLGKTVTKEDYTKNEEVKYASKFMEAIDRGIVSFSLRKFNFPLKPNITAPEIVNQYFQAIGGKEKIDEIKTIMIESGFKYKGIGFWRIIKKSKPNKISIETLVTGSSFSKNVFNGETGYTSFRGNKENMTAKTIEEAKQMSAPFTDFAFKKGILDRIETIDDIKYYVVKYRNIEAFYNVKSGLKAKEIKITTTKDGNQEKVIYTFTNYKAANGILFPHSWSVKSTKDTLDLAVMKVKLNENVTDKDFE
ncbi:hypothetical protein [Polaribacter marinivivus]|uniref:hypothetical protein n=1 Tax=Polaribacter marinivivus TaxID=1524260 RepID=UPI003D328B01